MEKRLFFTILLLNVCLGQTYGYPSDSETVVMEKKPYENPNLVEGDMIFPNEEQPTQRGVAGRGASVPWTNGIVPYEILPGYASTQEAFIIATMQKMEPQIAINNVKCIQFRPRISSDPYRQWQWLFITGFYHEQSRPDRDSYVRINYDNIHPSVVYNFNKYSNTTVNTLNTPCDYRSVMHYEKTDFSINGRPTIEPLVGNTPIGQRDNISAIDIQEVRLLYSCSGTGVTLPTTPATTTANLNVINTTISSSWTNTTQIYTRYTDSRSNYHYEQYRIVVPTTGSYLFMSVSSVNTFGSFYYPTFDQSYPTSSLIAYDDDSAGFHRSILYSIVTLFLLSTIG